MRKTIGALVIGLLLLSSNLAWGDGNELLSKCNKSIRFAKDTFDAGYCVGIVQGVMGATSYFNEVLIGLGGKKTFFCVPSRSVIVLQSIRIIVKYLNENPERLHMSETLLIGMALGEAFPCPGANALKLH